MRSSWRVTLAAAVVLAAFGSTEGAIRFVSASAPAGGDGQTWATACKYLQDALTAARVPGSGITEVWVAAGTYQPDRDAAHPGGTGDRNATFGLIDAGAIRGGFAGNEDPATFDLATRDLVANKTTLSGDLAGNDGPNFANNAENSYHVVVCTASNAALNGFTVTGGNSNGTSGAGGGVFGSSWSPTIMDCIVIGNFATSSGGGYYGSSGHPNFSRCTFSGNTAGSLGGGVCSEGDITFTSCTFTKNSSGRGGGIYDWHATVSCTDCLFSDNTASNGEAGAINLNYSDGTLEGCSFLRNTSTHGGGAVALSGLIASSLKRCKFIGNRTTAAATPGGGALFITNMGSATITNCLFLRNYAYVGGAVYNSSGAQVGPTFRNCTVVGNAAGSPTYWGVGFYSLMSVPQTFTNCLVWGNGGSAIYGAANVSYSCVEGGYTGTGNISADPRIAGIREDVLLRPGSPCIDAGNNSAVPSDIAADLVGRSRFVDDPYTEDTGDPGVPARAVVDIGAYEYSPVPTERLYVNASAAPGGDGSSWSSAYRFLQDAFATAEARAGVLEIWLAGGVYRPDRDEAHPNGTGLRSASFYVPGAVAVYGGFPGQAGQEGDLSVRNRDAYPTYLSGDLAGNDGRNLANNSENSYHVSVASGTGPSTVLDGLRICGGNANGVAPDDSGAGIYAAGGSPTLTNCLFYGNAANTNGGGLYCSASSVTNCGFAANSAAWAGGCYLLCVVVNPRLTNCTFACNSGGGLYVDGQNSPTLSNCIVWGNTAWQITQRYTNAAPILACSCIQGGVAAHGNIASDPQLVFVSGGDLRLRKGSPCIDAGSNARVPAGLLTDLNGASRFVDDPDTVDTGVGSSQAGVVDMGALEYQPGPAKRLYVDAGSAGGDGLSQATAFAHLQDAFKLAQGDPHVTEVWVGAGGYRPDRDAAHPAGTGDRTATFSAPGAVRIYGGFPTGTETAWDLADRDPSANPTVLSGDLAGNDGLNFANNAENSYHVVDASWTTAATVLDGLILSGGNANGTSAAGYGGGMYIASGGPTVNNCTLTANAAGSGGGLYNASTGTPVLTQCRFTANRATSGGGMWNASSAASVMSCTFSGNSATSSGGGLFNSGSAIKLVNGVFTGNSASSGGGVYSNGGSPAVVNSTLFGNSAASAGGGFFGMRATPTLTGCILWGNTAPSAAQISGAATTTYSCVQGGATGQGNTSLDPLFANAAAGDLRLSAASPCIDAGSNAAVPSGTLFDAAGRVRFMDIPGIADCPYASGTCGTAPIVDMGAYEFIPAITGDFDTDGDVDEADLSKLAACALGPGMGLSEGCELRRLDADEDIDLDDFGILQRCYSGYARAADANCGN